MRLLGLTGGTSWESTVLYYQLINRMTRERLGGHHSAPLVLRSVDFAPLEAAMAADDWETVARHQVEAARLLWTAGAEALVICANTMHKVADRVQAAVDLPLIHIADATADVIKAAGSRRPLLLATRYTMEQPFYRDRLARHGVKAAIPDLAGRDRLHAIIFGELVKGVVSPASKAELLALIAAMREAEGIDGVIFGCTEIGMLLSPDDFDIPTFDTAEIHARAAVDFALDDRLPSAPS